VAYCTNMSCTTAPTVTAVASTGAVGMDSSLAIGTDGLPIISFRDATAGDLDVAHCSNPQCTTATVSAADNGGTHIVGSYTSLAVGSDGRAVISYFDSTFKDLKVAHCNDVACTTATNRPVDTVGDVGSYTSIAIGSDNLPIISYYDQMNVSIKVTHCSNLDCSSHVTHTVDGAPVSTIHVGTNSSITIGSDGNPIISYYTQNSALKVAHCADVTCSSSVKTTLDNSGVTGIATSIAIGIDSRAVISYGDFTNHDLKIAHCEDVVCSTATTFSLDTVGDVGRVSSIAIGDDGLPIVGYNSLSPSGLKFVQARMQPVGLAFG